MPNGSVDIGSSLEWAGSGWAANSLSMMDQLCSLTIRRSHRKLSALSEPWSTDGSAAASGGAQKIAAAEVVLQDFDGTKTIVPAKCRSRNCSPIPIPPRDPIIWSYARTGQRDEHGRTVYVERN